MSTDSTQRQYVFDWSRLNNVEFGMVTAIIGGMMQPDLILAPNGKPYLYRWHVIPRNDRANVYLHIQVADDAMPFLHDHPYDNQSVILAGGYLEQMRYGAAFYEVARVAGDVIHRKAAHLHRLKMPPGQNHTISLFSTGPRIRVWGFLTPTGWEPFEDIVVTDGNTSTRKEIV